MYKVLLNLNIYLDDKQTKSKELHRKICLPYVPAPHLDFLIDSLKTEINNVLWHHQDQSFWVFLEDEYLDGNEELFERFTNKLQSEEWTLSTEENTQDNIKEVKFINCDQYVENMRVSNDFKISKS